jgi:L-cystine transport system permease protein
MIVMLYMVYFIMPILFIWLNDNAGFHINLRNTPTLTYAIVTFSVYTSAYFTEMYRSALGSVDAKQMEAAFSVGLTRAQGMWRIVLPQALVVAIPNIENSFLGILKGSSLAVYVGVLEIMNRAKLEAADGFRYIEVYTIAAVIYWIISVIIERLFSSVELKLQFEKKSWA